MAYYLSPNLCAHQQRIKFTTLARRKIGVPAQRVNISQAASKTYFMTFGAYYTIMNALRGARNFEKHNY
ncbi:hypothetical protein ACU8KH_02472 [Lachancea thermotolerans]